MRYLSLAVISCLLLLCAPAIAKQADIAGLTSGISIDDVASKLGSDYRKASTATIQRGEVFNFTNGPQGFNVLAMGGKVVYIEHQEFFPSTGLLSADELAKDLKEKYGAPSIKSDDDQSEAWIIIDDKIVPAAAVTDQQKGCLAYETQGPFFAATAEKTNFAFSLPRVPVQPAQAQCGMVIQAHPRLLSENPGLVSQLTVTLFDIKAAQAWYDAAMVVYNQTLKDAVDAARKNKPHL